MNLPLPSVHLTCPYPLDSLKGNAVSARRIVGVLKSLGCQVSAGTTNEPVEPSVEILLAMHATRSHRKVVEYRRVNPNGKLIVLLTGTDLYRDFPERNEDCLLSMELADLLIVTQTTSLNSLPERYRSKTMVVTKFLDVVIPEVDRSPGRDANSFVIETVFHGRRTKNPFLLLEAIALLPDFAEIRVKHLGSARGSQFSEKAKHWMNREPRYEWLGELPRLETLRRLQLADLTVNTSRVEGGANVIIEAVMCGVPLLATSIEATVGQLGEGFPGLYPSEDAVALSKLIRRCYEDREFLDELKSATVARQSAFTPEAEAAGWAAVIDRLRRG